MSTPDSTLSVYEVSLHPPPPGASLLDRLEFVQLQLSSLYVKESEILGGLVLQGSGKHQQFTGGGI